MAPLDTQKQQQQERAAADLLARESELDREKAVDRAEADGELRAATATADEPYAIYRRFSRKYSLCLTGRLPDADLQAYDSTAEGSVRSLDLLCRLPCASVGFGLWHQAASVPPADSAFLLAMASAAFFPSIPTVAADMGVSGEVINYLCVALYIVGECLLRKATLSSSED